MVQTVAFPIIYGSYLGDAGNNFRLFVKAESWPHVKGIGARSYIVIRPSFTINDSSSKSISVLRYTSSLSFEDFVLVFTGITTVT